MRCAMQRKCVALLGVLGARVAAAAGGGVSDGAGGAWERIGPWNIFDGTNPLLSPSMGEAGTLANAA